jgi:methylaspartate mutase epsilon subunit
MDIVAAMTGAGLYATEGGPVSYCLPYGRTPIGTSVRNWRQSCERLAAARRPGVEPHLETFGGCLLGQLCPPGLLVAVSLLEAVFFRRHGLRSVSLSYTQQTDARQDAEALAALRLLATEYLPDVDWHIVLYAYMGRFPATPAGARRLAARAASLAVAGGADRLIVKTAAEAHRIPTIAENVEALETAAADIAGSDIAGSDIAGSDIAGSDIAGPGTARPGTGRAGPPGGRAGDGEVLGEARALIGATLELAEDPGDALAAAVRRGYLDVPYCLHPDNAGRSRSYLAADGRIAWLSVGAMPLRPPRPGPAGLASAGLLDALTRTADRYDADGRIPDGYRPARR